MLVQIDNQSKIPTPKTPTRKCLQHARLTQESPRRGGGNLWELSLWELIHSEADDALQRTRRAVHGCVGGKGQRKGGRLLRAPAYAGTGVMCDSTGKKKRREITNSQYACLSCWMSNRDHKNSQDWAVIRWRIKKLIIWGNWCFVKPELLEQRDSDWDLVRLGSVSHSRSVTGLGVFSCPISTPRPQVEPWAESKKKPLKGGAVGRGEDFLSQKYTGSVFWRALLELLRKYFRGRSVQSHHILCLFLQGGSSGMEKGMDVAIRPGFKRSPD